jgi:hypothetical protein
MTARSCERVRARSDLLSPKRPHDVSHPSCQVTGI